MKKLIQNWLGITKQEEIDLTKFDKQFIEFEKRFTKLEDRFNWFMNEYHTNKCSSCESTILAHYGGFYRTSDGEVFCSDKCRNDVTKTDK